MTETERSVPPPSRDPRLIRAGRALDFLGQWTFPLGIGAVLGFYAADQGMPLMPTMMEIALGWGLAALVMIGVGRWLRGRAFVETSQGLRVRRRVVLAMVLGMLAVAGRLGVWFAERPAALTALTPDEFERSFELDADRYRELDAGMERLLTRLEAPGALATGADGVLDPDQEALLGQAWRGLYDHAIAMDEIRAYYEDYWHFDPSRVGRSYHLRSFLLTFAAELSLYEKAARLSALVLPNSNIKKFVDSPHPELGLPESSFGRYRENLLGARDQARVLAGEQYLDTLETLVGGRREATALGAGWLWRAIGGHLATIRAVAPITRASLSVRADSQMFKRQVRRVWFPIQKEAAEVLGDTRVRRGGWYLITHEQTEAVDPLLEPGDVLISRKNWYLSNIGLPGFWPHAILYIGDPEKLSAFFDEDPSVRAWMREKTGADVTFMQFLQSRHPTPALLHQLGDAEGPYRVIEAVSEGVVLNTLDHAAGDYLAGLRPRLDKLARAQAIDAAFSQFGKPYDFDFDFATDHAVVCTELVWRAYRPAEGKAGLELTLSKVAGRMTLPANDLVRLYAEFAATSEPLLDFVFFLDAIEREQRAEMSDEGAFRESWERVKWDVAQR